MSRWTMPLACAASSASAIWIAELQDPVRDRAAACAIRSSSVCPSSSSIGDEALALVLRRCRRPCRCGWSRADAARASRWKRSSAARVLRPSRRQELERHGAPEPRVLGLVDDAHAAAAELGDAVVRDGLADHAPPSTGRDTASRTPARRAGRRGRGRGASTRGCGSRPPWPSGARRWPRASSPITP